MLQCLPLTLAQVQEEQAVVGAWIYAMPFSLCLSSLCVLWSSLTKQARCFKPNCTLVLGGRWDVSFVSSVRAAGPSSALTQSTARAPPSSAPSTTQSDRATSRVSSRTVSS